MMKEASQRHMVSNYREGNVLWVLLFLFYTSELPDTLVILTSVGI